jgi:signal peptidase I
MKPTILEGDRIFVNKLAFDLKLPFTTWRLAEWSEPRRGDIVVLFSPHDETRLVKRVVGIAGDHVEVRDNRLLVNEAPASHEPVRLETMIVHPHAAAILQHFGPVVVPAGHDFVMGDNRDQSFDSRWFGPEERERIVGRATRVVLSFDLDHHYRPRWERFFRPLS